MNKNNVDQALAALADALKSTEPNTFLDNPLEFIKKIPYRSLSGDHIRGGKVVDFKSAGIVDSAETTQLTISNNGIAVKTFAEGFKVIGNIEVEDAKVKVLKADVIQASSIIGSIDYASDSPIKFEGDSLEGKGLLWAGRGNTKQFIFASNPDRFFCSENIDFARGKGISVNGINLFTDSELGPTVTKSNLQQVGRLNGLIVDGDVSIGQYLIFSNATNRLGLGIETPNAAFSVAEDGIEVVVGTKDFSKGYIGTYASNAFDIVTDNVARISISSGGNIILGNNKLPPIQVNVHGKLSVKVNVPDPEVDLHVAGAVKFSNRLQKVDKTYPTEGTYNAGDIVWNSDPKINQYVGWVCVQPGTPGLWEPFGKIGNS